MATRRTSRSFLTSHRSRRKLVWGRFFTNSSIITAGDVKLTPLADLETALGANLIGATVMRLRGRFVYLSTTGTVSVQTGIMVGSATVAAGQVTPLNRYEDWMYWDSYHSSGAGFTAIEPALPIHLDLKAKRKLEEVDQELQILIHNSGATTCTFFWMCNVLVALS